MCNALRLSFVLDRVWTNKKCSSQVLWAERLSSRVGDREKDKSWCIAQKSLLSTELITSPLSFLLQREMVMKMEMTRRDQMMLAFMVWWWKQMILFFENNMMVMMMKIYCGSQGSSNSVWQTFAFTVTIGEGLKPFWWWGIEDHGMTLEKMETWFSWNDMK